MDLANLNSFYRSMISRSIASKVREWRVDEGCSWRKVHENFQLSYIPKDEWWFNTAMLRLMEDTSLPHGKQVDGAMICEIAMEVLGETNYDGWN